jgi:hypothetical protein
MKRYLACALVAVALALNAQARDKYKDYNGPVASVPDNGSTAILLGAGFLALALASRRFAVR